VLFTTAFFSFFFCCTLILKTARYFPVEII
jgi:hypothetical protein